MSAPPARANATRTSGPRAEPATPAGAAGSPQSGPPAREGATGPRRIREVTNPHRNEAGSDAAVRRRGRAFILSFYGALRAIKLYPVENDAVVKALEDLTSITQGLLQQEHDLEFRTGGEFIFINATRLRLDLDNYASFSQLLTMFRSAGIGSLRVAETVGPRDWLVFLSLVQAPGDDDPEQRFQQITAKLTMANVSAFELAPPNLGGAADGLGERQQTKEAAKRTYAQSVSVSKEVIHSVRMGRAPNIKKIKRVVQAIVDQILNEETSLFGLTTLRDYDEYTFTHSVNVCIFAVALGRRLGLSKLQLYDLGLAALFHDIGKARVPLHVLNKAEQLSEADWRAISNHPWLGVLSLFQMRGATDLPYRSMVVAYEHHMKHDMTGYPRPVRPRDLSIFSKIVAVADGFDAATTHRAYQGEPMSPAAVIQEMRDNPKRGMDPVVVKAFMNLLGLYPVGTVVVLDTFELGIVHATNPNPDLISRPIVRVVSDAQGNVLFPGELVDLATQLEGGVWARTIIKTADAARYGIRVADYFV
jgi:HD-GYP domain-containing protein (c-di-GMP phosphodiesterase class II)